MKVLEVKWKLNGSRMEASTHLPNNEKHRLGSARGPDPRLFGTNKHHLI